VRLNGYLGISKKRGVLWEGRKAVLRNIKKGKLLIVASDLSPKEKERFKNLAERFRIPFLEYGSKEELGKILGRRPVGVLLINSLEMANQILKTKEDTN